MSDPRDPRDWRERRTYAADRAPVVLRGRRKPKTPTPKTAPQTPAQ